MKNTFGQNVTITLFGESHGAAVGAVLDGIAAGLPADETFIAQRLTLRRPQLASDTARKEKDDFRILSGVKDGFTTGAPLTVIVPNEDIRSGDYEQIRNLPRPSHADYAARIKYGGYEDYRGGGHFSGRVTAALVAAGAILLQALENKGVIIGSHILSCGNVSDERYSLDPTSEIKNTKGKPFPVLNDNKQEEMLAEIAAAAKNNDSIGGTVETAICGLPAGLGEPWFDSIESMLSHAVFSLGGVKGIEFGAGFSLPRMRGSEANDEFYVGEGKKILTRTNNSGGINGGISNGMPIVFTCAVKPTASVAKPQHTVNLCTETNAELALKGRHDPAIVRRICPVIESAAAIVLCDFISARYGTNALADKNFRF
ncbi:MAG: chorismate synthase [Christensenellaceae bacterium]